MSKKKFLFQKKDFDGWKTLNDTVMGGSSSAFCEISNSGLLLKGNIVEKAGGFVSCRSPIYKPSLNVSEYSSFELNIDGQGRTFKFAVACEDDLLGLPNLFLVVLDGLNHSQQKNLEQQMFKFLLMS